MAAIKIKPQKIGDEDTLLIFFYMFTHGKGWDLTLREHIMVQGHKVEKIIFICSRVFFCSLI